MSSGKRPGAARVMPPAPPRTWSAAWFAAGLALVTTCIALLCAKPVGDSDLWYHMAYGRQMLENGSLRLDHTTFSWTPTENGIIYCAWIAQLLFLTLYDGLGLPALFATRYAVFVAAFGAMAWFAWRMRVAGHPLVWFVAVLALLMSSGAFLIKPQLLSFGLMTALVIVCAWIRHRGDAAAPLAVVLPLLMLVWVNTHGGFVVGLAYLAAFALGEAVNLVAAPSQALSPRMRRRLAIAAVACVAVTALTPYGSAYPLQFFTVELSALDLGAVRDYDSILAPAQRPLHYVEYGAGALVILGLLFAARLRRGAIDWSLVVTNVVFAAMYVYYVRLTFFWAPIVLATAIALLVDGPAWLWPGNARRARTLGAALTLATALLGFQAVRADAATPVVGSWRGFGNGYWNPEAEAEYLARHFPIERLGNDYNSGGYLLWRLGPKTKVFMDARYFPYRAWFQEYLTLESANGIDALLRRYPTDVWCVSLHLPRTVEWFRRSPDWTPAFYGSSAAIFVRRGTPLPEGRLQAAPRVSEIRNLFQAIVVLAFAFDVNDLDGATRVVQGMESRFTSNTERRIVTGARTALDGLVAHARGDHGNAIRLLSAIAEAYQGAPAAALADSAMVESQRLWLSGDDAGALVAAQLAARFAPQSPAARYNAGAFGWWRQRGGGSADGSWRLHLDAFTRMPATSGGQATALEAARAMLSGTQQTRPFVLTTR